jgi:hypothetical protein
MSHRWSVALIASAAALCASSAQSQPANCQCGSPAGAPCVGTACLLACYNCCNGGCTQMQCCQDWCDTRGLTCHDTPPVREN